MKVIPLKAAFDAFVIPSHNNKMDAELETSGHNWEVRICYFTFLKRK